MKGRFGCDDARHYALARLRFHASGRGTFCSATSSALWNPTQVAFHGSSFAGPLPSAAPVTDGNEDMSFFMSHLTSAKQDEHALISRVCVCVTQGKTKFLKDFC